MTVRDFIPLFFDAGNTSATSANTRELKKRFTKFLNEDVLTLGNDTLLALEFNTSWEKIHEFVQTHKPKA